MSCIFNEVIFSCLGHQVEMVGRVNWPINLLRDPPSTAAGLCEPKTLCSLLYLVVASICCTGSLKLGNFSML